MLTESEKKAVAKYQKNKTKMYSFKFVISSDSDIINWLDNQQNRQAAVKQLIRNEIAKTGYDRKQAD